MGLNNSRYILKYLVFLLTFFILWPLFTLIREGLYGIQKGSIYLTTANLNEIKGTILLLIFSLTPRRIFRHSKWLDFSQLPFQRQKNT